MGEPYVFRDSLWVLVRKILGWMSEIAGSLATIVSSFTGGVVGAFVTLLPSKQVAAFNTTVTVSGANIQVLAQNPNRRHAVIQNYGAQSCELTMGNAAGTDGQTLYPVGIMTTGDADISYTGAIYAKWNGTTTTLKVLEINYP